VPVMTPVHEPTSTKSSGLTGSDEQATNDKTTIGPRLLSRIDEIFIRKT